MTTDQDSKPQILATATGYAGWSKLLVATIQLPDGRRIKREIEDHGSAVCVLPYHQTRRTAVLVRQLRAPVLFVEKLAETLEAIAGIIEGEDADACAHREVMEEAQLKLNSLERLFIGWTMPGISTERMHFYLAVYSGEPRAEIAGGVAGEDESTIAVEFNLADLAQMADRNELKDVKTLLLLQKLRLRQPQLFER